MGLLGGGEIGRVHDDDDECGGGGGVGVDDEVQVLSNSTADGNLPNGGAASGLRVRGDHQLFSNFGESPIPRAPPPQQPPDLRHHRGGMVQQQQQQLQRRHSHQVRPHPKILY